MTVRFENTLLPEYCEILACLKDGQKEKTLLVYDGIGKRKAILKLSSNGGETLKTEADIISFVAGEGVPELYGFYAEEDRCCLMREYIEGESLLDYCQKRGKLSVRETIDVALKLCDILERLHSRKSPIIHRDIKTENIIRTPEGAIFLIDFGISRVYDGSAEHDTCVMGTPAYASPEQFGFRQTDERSDIYSFGCLLHELSTGERELSKGVPEKPLGGIIRKCTSFSPDDRFQSVTELRRRLIYDTKKSGCRLGTVFTCCLAAVLTIGAALAIYFHVFSDKVENTGEVESETYYTDRAAGDSEAAVFKDKAIEAAIRELLDKPSGEIALSELETVTELYLIGAETGENWNSLVTRGEILMYGDKVVASRGGAASLEDMAMLPNLRTLALCNQDISDLSPLAGSRIERLALHGNSVSDLSPLAKCGDLSELIISDNPVTEFSSLSHCKRLWKLTAGATPIESLDGIAEIPYLINLNLHNCDKLCDFSAFKEMCGLTSLMIKPAPKAAIEEISEMEQLEYLYVWDARELTELSQFSRLSNLKILLTDLCPITLIEGLDAFPELISLSIQNTLIEDLTPLGECKGLEQLSVCGIPADNWEILSTLDSLTCVYCDEIQREDIEHALKGNESVNVIVNDLY